MTQEELEKQLADLLREEINKELIVQTAVSRLTDLGWTMVLLSYNSDTTGMDEWMQTNIWGDWRLFTGVAVFEDAEEAVLFKLRWA